MKRLAMLAMLLLVLMLAAGAYVLRARRAGTRPVLPTLGATDMERAPTGVRIRVQVLNATRTKGLARRATRLLRDRGYDVVEIGTTGPIGDTTLVLARSGHPEWAAAIARALGPVARSTARPDSSRYLDVTVLLGGAWRPPAEPLDP
jgi:hypothetical protein